MATTIELETIRPVESDIPWGRNCRRKNIWFTIYGYW